MRISYSLQAIGQKVADILAASGLNVSKWSGSNVAAPNVAGYPLVDTRYHRGTLENVLIGGRRDVNAQVVGDKTGYSLTVLVQRGTINIANTASTATATLSTAVDRSRSFTTMLGAYNSVSTDVRDHFVAIDLTNTTTVTATRGGTSGGQVISFEVVTYL